MMPLPRLAAWRASCTAEVSSLLGSEWRGRDRSEVVIHGRQDGDKQCAPTS
jgi:hypothetical protein